MNESELQAFIDECQRAYDAMPTERKASVEAQRKARESARKRYTVEQLLAYFSTDKENKS